MEGRREVSGRSVPVGATRGELPWALFLPRNRTSELPRIRLAQFANTRNSLSLLIVHLLVTRHMEHR